MRGTVLPLAFIAQALNPIYIFFFYFTAQVSFTVQALNHIVV